MEPNQHTIGRIILAFLLLSSISVGCMFLHVDKILKNFMLWVQKDMGLWGPVIYALAYIPCTIFAIPSSILTLGGGYLYGLVIGFITDSIGSTTGATAAFMVGRTIGRSYVSSKLKDYPHFQAIALAIEKSGFKIVLLLRMVPLLPFSILNYLLAITPISCYTYTLASWLGMMPMTLVFVYAGTTIKDITDFSHHGGHFTSSSWILLGVGLFTSMFTIILVTRIAKNALQRAVNEIDNKDKKVLASTSTEQGDSMIDLQQPLMVKGIHSTCIPCFQEPRDLYDYQA